jgi:hypothetical protein
LIQAGGPAQIDHKSFGPGKNHVASDSQVKSTKFRKKNFFGPSINDVKQILNCPVCLEIVTDAHVLKPCDHLFCGNCIAKWEVINTNCPVCKCELLSHSHSKILEQVAAEMRILKVEIEKLPDAGGKSGEIFNSDSTSEVNPVWIVEGKII